MRDFLRLFGARFSTDSWAAWLSVLDTAFGQPPADPALVRRLTGRSTWPTEPVKELWAIVGRRGGKSQVAALIAVYLACFKTYDLAPGEVGTLMLLAENRKQARVVKRYVLALMESVPALRALIANPTVDAIELTNGIVIEIHTANFKGIRGYTVIGAVCDEIAFWADEDGANPTGEILTALRPAMLTVPGALLVAISSPYARRGELWRAYQKHFGRDGDPVLVVQADTRTMNPLVPEDDIRAAMEEDVARASSEYGAEFRSDLESLFTLEALRAVTPAGVFEIPPDGLRNPRAFVDPSGGSSDSFTLGIAATAGEHVETLLALREWKPPFSPAAVVEEIVQIVRSYGIRQVVGDAYSGEFVRELFRKSGVDYKPSPLNRSGIYLDALALINSRRCALLDVPKLLTQAATLERRTGRTTDVIDHPPGGHDDLINAGRRRARGRAEFRRAAPHSVFGVTM